MDFVSKAREYVGRKMSNMSTSDRVNASREAKELVLEINETYKKTKDEELMQLMKDVTEKKRKIEKRLRGRLEV